MFDADDLDDAVAIDAKESLLPYFLPRRIPPASAGADRIRCDNPGRLSPDEDFFNELVGKPSWPKVPYLLAKGVLVFRGVGLLAQKGGLVLPLAKGVLELPPPAADPSFRY